MYQRLWLLTLLVAASAIPAAAPPQPAFEDVVRNLRNPDAKARFGAVRTLREAQHAEAAVPLAAVVNDPIEEIQLEAIAAEMSFWLIDDIPARRRVGLFVEVRSKGHAVQAFERGPLATWPHPAPPEVVDALLKAVDDESSRVRNEAIYALGVVGRQPLTGAAADGLTKALDHYDPSIRVAAARVIARLKLARAADALIDAMNDSNRAVRFAAMRALGAIREERAVHSLTEQLAYYGKGEGAWSALDALAQIGHPSSVALFKARLTDRDPYLRRAAAEGLARAGDPSALAEIETSATTDESPMVRAAMTFAMRRLGRNVQARLVEYLGSDRTSGQVEGYLLELGPPAAADLSASLSDPNPEIRGRVADLVGALGAADSAALLEPLTRDRDRNVAQAATTALARLKMRG